MVNETGKRSLRTYKACMMAAVESQVDQQPAPPAEKIPDAKKPPADDGSPADVPALHQAGPADGAHQPKG